MKRKFIASVLISVFAFSALQPVFADDMREENLNRRERMLTERALMLSDQSVNLDDREAELNRRSAKLEEMFREVQSRNVDFSVREIELDEMRASFNRDTEFLAHQTQELQQDRQRFAEFKAEVEKRAEEADRIAREAEERFKAAEERNDRTAQREKELSRREEEIKASLSQIEISRADILARQKETEEDAKKAEAQLEALAKQKKDLEEAQAIFTSERGKLEAERTDLESLRAEVESAMNDAKNIRAEAEEKIRKADEIIKINEEQKVKIAQLTQELEHKESQLQALFNPPNNNGELYAMLPGVRGNASVTVTDSGIMNWSDGSIRAKGFGVAPEKTVNEAQARALARRAAIVDLQRNLLETVQGVQIDAHTKMVNFMADDTVSSAVKGTIKGVEVIEEKWDSKDKSYTVFGQIRQEKMSSAMSKVRQHITMVRSLPREPKKKTGKYTGLILDVRHLSVEQQKFFHIVDEKGTLVYGSEYADKKIQDRSGLCAYFENIVLRDDERNRVGDNPLVVKAQRIAGNGTDIVIPNTEAERVRTNAIDFRKECRVILVRS